ncbi:MAG: sterol desaturase family protein [Chromatiales bacterium]|nr:sterol desaturase family protein [Chromatiales bacterium]
MITNEALAEVGRVFYWVAGLGFFFLIIAESLRPALPFAGEAERIRHIARNFGLWLVTFTVGDLAFGIGILDLQNHLTETWFGPFHWLDLPWWFEVTAGLLIVDLSEYVFHRLSHGIRPLWLVHAVHHSDPHLDATTSLRFHPGEVIANISWKVLVCGLMGIPFWIVGLRGIVMGACSLLQHANIVWPDWLDRALRIVIITPALHRMHHSPEPAENNTNFGEVLSIWDRLFGTYSEAEAGRAPVYGLPRLRETKWQTVLGLVGTPVTARHFPQL